MRGSLVLALALVIGFAPHAAAERIVLCEDVPSRPMCDNFPRPWEDGIDPPHAPSVPPSPPSLPPLPPVPEPPAPPAPPTLPDSWPVVADALDAVEPPSEWPSPGALCMALPPRAPLDVGRGILGALSRDETLGGVAEALDGATRDLARPRELCQGTFG